MSDKISESLSALLDNEATELDVRRLTKHMTDEDLETWRSMCAVQSAMHKEDTSLMSVNLLDGIRAGISDEPAPVQEKSSSFKSWLGGVGIAAAVAMAVVGIGLQNDQFSGGEAQFAENDKPKVETSEKPNREVASPTRLAASDMTPEQYEALQNKLRAYMQHHAENSNDDRVGDVLPYARAVSFDVDGKEK